MGQSELASDKKEVQVIRTPHFGSVGIHQLSIDHFFGDRDFIRQTLRRLKQLGTSNPNVLLAQLHHLAPRQTLNLVLPRLAHSQSAYWWVSGIQRVDPQIHEPSRLFTSRAENG